MQIVSHSDIAELGTFQEIWDRLSELELQFVPSFAELLHYLRASGAKFRLVSAMEGERTVALACFIYKKSIKRYEVATHKLFDLPVQEVSLFGATVLGQPDEPLLRKIFAFISEGAGFDLVNIGEIFTDSPLYRVIKSLPGFTSWRVMRKEQTRWMIELRGTFDDYVSALRRTAKTRIMRDVRRFERAGPQYRVVERPEDVEAFLREAAEVCALTYQWNLGYRLFNDERTRERLTRFARQGTFRGYIASINGKPCAFGWGELAHRTFGFTQTGYDPQYRNISPGTALIMHMMRDLIENTNCEVFDFGSGGDEGYKSRLSTVSLGCARMQMAQIYSPYSLLLIVLDRSINVAKNSAMNLLEWIAGHGALKQRLKSVLRPYGIGSY